MARALNRLRPALHYRRGCFDQGLLAAGFELAVEIAKPEPGDLLLTWNRYAAFHEQARYFESRGATVIVCENGWLGKSWNGGEWFALSLNHHAGAGCWPVGGPERWGRQAVGMAPWRDNGGEVVVLGQRGIGEPGVASPARWAEGARRKVGGRIRPHPGLGPSRPLADDLANASEVVTWHSGAALQALILGVPVWYEFPQWIGAGAARHLSEWPGEAKRDDAARLAMFQRLAWAMWDLEEVRTGEAIRWLLNR